MLAMMMKTLTFRMLYKVMMTSVNAAIMMKMLTLRILLKVKMKFNDSYV